MVGSVDKEKAKQLLGDIETLQWSCSSEQTFSSAYQLLREKYEPYNDKPGLKSSLESFFKYFESTWISSEERLWYEGANPYRCSNNQGIEGKNKAINQG